MTTSRELEDMLLKTVPVNIERIIKSHDIILNKSAESEEIARGANRSSEEKFIGEIRKEGDSYKILVLGSDHFYRKRFTMAHALGHFLFHKEIIDRVGSIVESIDYRDEKLTDDQEREADALAEVVLLPKGRITKAFRETFKSKGGDLECVIDELSKMFQVTKASIRYRLDSLDLVPQNK